MLAYKAKGRVHGRLREEAKDITQRVLWQVHEGWSTSLALCTLWHDEENVMDVLRRLQPRHFPSPVINELMSGNLVVCGDTCLKNGASKQRANF